MTTVKRMRDEDIICHSLKRLRCSSPPIIPNTFTILSKIQTDIIKINDKLNQVSNIYKEINLLNKKLDKTLEMTATIIQQQKTIHNLEEKIKEFTTIKDSDMSYVV